MAGTKAATQKQIEAKRFADALLAGNNNSQAALIANPNLSPKSAGVVGQRMSNSVYVQDAVLESLTRAGFDQDEYVRQYIEELTATKRIYFKGDYVEDVPDYPTRQKARDALLHLAQAYQPKPQYTDPPTPDGVAPISNESMQKEIRAAVKRGDIKTVERIVFNDKDKTG